jgi:hypothetical protein
METIFDKDRLLQDETVTIGAWLYEGGERQSDLHVIGGEPIADAIVTADIVHPDGNDTTTVTFQNIGEGEYACAFTNTNKPGSYKFIIKASKFDASINDRKILSQSEHSIFVTLPLVGEIDEIKNLIAGLEDSAFKPKADKRKKSFEYKLDVIQKMIDNENYQDAIEKLQNDILTKIDGFHGGDPDDDWIIDEVAQNDVYQKVVNLILILEGLNKKAEAESESDQSLLPTKFDLEQNYPNPFNPYTDIRFHLPQETRVTLRIYNILGQLITTVVDELKPAGSYSVRWEGRDDHNVLVGSGVYFYRIETESGFIQARKMLYIK